MAYLNQSALGDVMPQRDTTTLEAALSEQRRILEQTRSSLMSSLHRIDGAPPMEKQTNNAPTPIQPSLSFQIEQLHKLADTVREMAEQIARFV